MPTAKGKGDSASPRYRPACEYDDATLAQKREYWRTKKREQRARLSERRGRPVQDSRGKKLLPVNAPAVVNPSLSPSFAAFPPPLQCKDESLKTANVSPLQSGNSVLDSSVEATESQKEKWLQTMKLNKVLPQSPGSCSMSAEAAEGIRATERSSAASGAVRRAVTSPTAGGLQLNTTSSVPPVTVTRITNGSSAKTAPQPRVSMQGASVPNVKQKGQVALRIQPKPLLTNVTTGMILVSPPRATVSFKMEGKAANTTPQSGTKCALVTSQGPEGVGNSRPSPESEEERAARRREHWRIKKREQRAKVAAQIAKAREMALQRQAAQKTGLLGTNILQNLSSQSAVRGVGQGLVTTRVKTSLPPARRVNDKRHDEAAGLATVNLQTHQIKVQTPHEKRTVLTAIPSGEILGKKPGESHRRPPSYGHFSNVTRGIARCKTPRQRFIEAQKTFMTQRSIRCKSPSLASVFGTRNIPKIDPNDTPEQIIAKRREYWRIKKREQRAKLSLEVKARLKERDSLMRRVKRYQRILEEMRRARVLTQSAGSSLSDTSETIGGFIKEDGTVSVNIPPAPTDHGAAKHRNKEEPDVVCDNAPITKQQHQPDSKGRGTTPIRVNQLPARRPQVRVSLPLARQSVDKARLLPLRPRTRLESTAGPNSHSSVCQLTLTHPQSSGSSLPGGSAADPTPGGCVMKMAVSSSAPSLSALSLEPGLTEEERMAKKREYWRIKKREQRAACAARLRQGALQTRATMALQRRKAQKLVALAPRPQSARPASRKGDAQPLPNNSTPVTPHAREIKQESESMPAVHLNSQAICPDINPPSSPTPPAAPQPECDPALNADSQATTLLAVASMKKLLEESLSTVMECKSEPTEIKTESVEETLEQEMKPNLPQLFYEKDEVDPITADLTLEIKSWPSENDALVQPGSPSPRLKDTSQSSDTPLPLSTSSEVILHPTCDHSSQTSSNFIVNPFMAVSGSPPSPHRTQRLCTKTESQENSCSPEPPKLHHLPTTQPPIVSKLQPQQQCEQQCQAQEQCWNSSSPSAQRYRSGAAEHSGMSSLQRKREYWKLMKRQQRARLKARQKDRHGEGNGRLSHRNTQAPALVIVNTAKAGNPPAKPALQPKPCNASVSAGKRIPRVLVVTPTACNAEQLPDTLQVKLPVISVSCSPTSEHVNLNVGPTQTRCDQVGAPQHQQQAMPGSHEWMCGSTDTVDSAPSLPTLKPPDNPLSNINLQPIEPIIQTPNPTLSPITIPRAQSQSPTHMMPKLAPLSTMVPPKLIPGESEEEFLRRKREYWRIKKKEQRARKAIRDKGVTPRRAPSSWRPILPAQDPPAPAREAQQDSSGWTNSSEDSGHLLSASVDTDPESFVYSNYTAPIEDEAEFLLADYENNSGEDGPVSDAVWRSRYLMDYDPLNQLLVCMVCGEQQYSHSLEGVRAHIDETHPHTLTLEPGEQQRILEAWDEQVSQRERFFTSQLQQHSGALTETHRN